MNVTPNHSSFLWNITPVPKSSTHLFLCMKFEDNMPEIGMRSLPSAFFKPSIICWQLLITVLFYYHLFCLLS